MRIAQVAPLYESVPPRYYGGTERVVSYLTEELVRLGHDVTLFASGDSLTGGRLVPVCPRSLRLDEASMDPVAYHMVQIERVYALAHRFDVIHFHTDYLHFPATRRHSHATLTTLHGRLDIPELVPLYAEYADIPLISISEEQRRPLPHANWIDTVYHGLPADSYRFNPNPQGYLAFLGRFSPEKRVDRAIEIAKRVGMPLRIAAKIDEANPDYFHEVVKPLLDDPNVDYIGEISESEKSDFLGNATALLFPIDWPEPFGLVMVESLACGTPVIAYNHGSVPEIMVDGLTGYIAVGVDGAVDAVKRISRVDRHACRAYFEARFTVERMTQEYVRVYEQLLDPVREVSVSGQGDPSRARGGLLHRVDDLERRWAHAGTQAR